MIISPKVLLKLVREKGLIEDLADRELNNPEGAGFDLRLGEVHKIVGGAAFIGITERETPTMETIFKYDKGKKQTVRIMPGEYYLLTTVEKVNLPLDLVGNLKPRTTTFRSGLIVRTGTVQPGYQGKLTFGAYNGGPLPIVLEMGCRFVHIQFYEVRGKGSQYRGQWQGGRVTTERREKQV